MADFRALCAELLQPLSEYDDANPYHEHCALITRARSALAQPKPPSLAEQATAELDDAVMRGDCITTTDAMPLLRAALKRLAELEALPDD